MADDIGGEDIVVPPPAPAPAPPPPVEEDRFKLYLSGITGYSWAKGEAGGKNDCCRGLGGSPGNGTRRGNNGSDWDTTVFGGGALGLDADLGPVGIRFEIEGQAARGYDMKTDGPIRGAGPYHVSTISWAMFANLFMDIPITEKFDFYLGGGIGAGIHDIKVNQKQIGVKNKDNDDASWALQAGAGFAYDVVDWLTLDVGYRYVTFGDLDVDLSQPIGGDYKLNLHSHDAILGVRINYYSF